MANKMKKFMDFAKSLAELSHCKRATAGCVICPMDFSQVYAIGYNGPPSGLPNDGCTNKPKECGCIHAEANALIKLGDIHDALLLTTRAPCFHCAGLIINSKKISQVHYIQPYTDSRGIQDLKAVGILVRKWKNDRIQ